MTFVHSYSLKASAVGRISLWALWAVFFSPPVLAQLKVITTISDLHAIVREVGGQEVTSEALCKGSQDPHFIEPKPSYMVKANRADLVVAIGLGLELAWLPSIIQGARNPRIVPGQAGYLELGPTLDPLDIPQGKVTRAEGDVHPEGNPHVTLDPLRAGKIALLIARRLGELDPAHSSQFTSRAEALQRRLEGKVTQWQERLGKSGNGKIITFHKTLSYFFDRFHLQNSAILEPLPGIPPAAKHVLGVIAKAKAEQISLILVENYFDTDAAHRVAREVTGLRVAAVPVAVEGDSSIKTLDDLYEHLVQVIEGKIKNG